MSNTHLKQNMDVEISELIQTQKHRMVISSRADLRRSLLLRYGSLTEAAIALQLNYKDVGHVLAARSTRFGIIRTLQREFGLTNEQVLEFWPLLKKWPRGKEE